MILDMDLKYKIANLIFDKTNLNLPESVLLMFEILELLGYEYK